MSRRTIVTGVVLDDGVDFSLGELCRCCGISAETALEMVDEGLLDPIGGDPASWRFRGSALWRVRAALRLTHDLRVNLAGAALALELMDELDDLRRHLRRLHGHAEPDGSR